MSLQRNNNTTKEYKVYNTHILPGTTKAGDKITVDFPMTEAQITEIVILAQQGNLALRIKQRPWWSTLIVVKYRYRDIYTPFIF
jgi:sulfate adenylyltransferase subunit 1 (EFTu-like GTPase family)